MIKNILLVLFLVAIAGALLWWSWKWSEIFFDLPSESRMRADSTRILDQNDEIIKTLKEIRDCSCFKLPEAENCQVNEHGILVCVDKNGYIIWNKQPKNGE